MCYPFLSEEEARHELECSEEEIQRYMKDGKLREFRDGPIILFKKEEVETLMIERGIPLPTSDSEPQEHHSS